MSAALSSTEDREFFRLRVFPLLKLPAHKKLAKAINYFAAKTPAYDEVMVDVRSSHHGASKGWQGLSPCALMESNANSPDNIISELTRIQSGKTPTCAYEYLLSPAEQIRIKTGVRPETKGLIRDGDGQFKAEKKLGATGMMNAEFDRTSVEMADKKYLAEKGTKFPGLGAVVAEMDRVEPGKLVGLDGKEIGSKAVSEPVFEIDEDEP